MQDHETIRAQEALENFRISRSHRSVCSLVCLAACLVYNGPVGPGSGTFDQNMASAGAGPGRRWGIDGPDRLCQLLRSACIANEDSNRDRSPVSTCGCRGFFGAVRARAASVDEGQGALQSTRVGTDNGRGAPRRRAGPRSSRLGPKGASAPRRLTRTLRNAHHRGAIREASSSPAVSVSVRGSTTVRRSVSARGALGGRGRWGGRFGIRGPLQPCRRISAWPVDATCAALVPAPPAALPVAHLECATRPPPPPRRSRIRWAATTSRSSPNDPRSPSSSSRATSRTFEKIAHHNQDCHRCFPNIAPACLVHKFVLELHSCLYWSRFTSGGRL